nr:mucin-7-like [Procambarus clarkii]
MTSVPPAGSTEVSDSDITVNTATLTDLLSTASTPAPTATAEEAAPELTPSHPTTYAAAPPTIPATAQSAAMPPSEPLTTIASQTLFTPTEPFTLAAGPTTTQLPRTTTSAFRLV